MPLWPGPVGVAREMFLAVIRIAAVWKTLMAVEEMVMVKETFLFLVST
jgi:hypothetical protein